MRKLTVLTAFVLYMLSVNASPKKSKKFEIRLPTKCEVADKTPKFNMLISDIDSYTELDINVLIVESERNAYVMAYTISDNGVILDTLVCEFNLYIAFNKTWKTEKIKPEISFSKFKAEYLANNKQYQEALSKSLKLIDKHKISYANAVKAKQINKQRIANYNERKVIEDSIRNEEKSERERIAKMQQEQSDRAKQLSFEKRVLGDIHYEFAEPTSQIKTKSIINNLGAKISYEYYVNENGYEVKHGKYSISMNFNNHKYWTGLSAYGWVYLDGVETLTYYYRNDIVHGKLVYSRNVSTTSTFGNAMKLKDSYNLDIYKGFLNGQFKFEYKDITYTGNAVNGILASCDYQTNDGFHDKLSSITSNPAYLSIAKINTGYRTFEFDSSIELPSIITTMPMFRFPLIGSND